MKYHSNAQSYYQQIRAASNRLCWDRGQPTFRSMLEADLRTAIEDANDLDRFDNGTPAS